MLEITDTQCCAVKEIYQLRDHKTPEDAMKKLCRDTWTWNRYSYEARDYVPEPRPNAKMSGLYTFTGVIRHTNGSKVRGGPDYGPNFAKFIRKNKLGTVTGSAEAINRRNHPTHVVRVWVWKPDQRAVKAWYKKNVLDKEVNNGQAVQAGA